MSELHEMSLRERIRLNLVSSMEAANINQVQLADKLGISKGTVNNWARGNNSPDVEFEPIQPLKKHLGRNGLRVLRFIWVAFRVI